MAKHIIFLVHGMGRYGKVGDDGKYKPDQDGWFKDAETELKAIYDKFIKDKPKLGAGVAFGDRFQIIRVEYDSILEEFRRDWELQSKEWGKLGLTGLAGEIRTFFEGNSEDAFLWTHVADVALYVAETVRRHVQTHFALQVFTGLKAAAEQIKAEGGVLRWSVIAHSLGTAVAHDTLGKLQQLAAQDEDLNPVWTPPRVVCMAANVACALTDNDLSVYGNAMAPTGPDSPNWYLNCNHALDPFTRIDPFAPTAGGWTAPDAGYLNLSRLTEYYLVKDVIEWLQDGEDFEKFAAVVPHGFAHYMRQPRIAATLWPCLLGKSPFEWSQVIEPAVRDAYAADRRDELKAELSTRLEEALGPLAQTSNKTIKVVIEGLIGALRRLG